MSRKMRRFGRYIAQFLVTFCLFFALCAFVITCSFLLFFSSIEFDKNQLGLAAGSTFFNAILLTILMTVVDMVRRHITVDRPMQQITKALDSIQNGDFSVRLDPRQASADFKVIMERINVMTEELSGLETLRTDFVSNVSHELKTPLAVMHNYATLLQNPALSADERDTCVRGIMETSMRMSDLISNILRLNRLENQQIFPTPKIYDMGEQLCVCLVDFEQVWEEKNIDIQTNFSEDMTVTADEELLSVVWHNLLSNAFKFTPNGGTVCVSAEANDTHVIVSVSDTGCGMNPQVGKHIFEKFYQGDSSHATSGNGLGLALVKRIMDIIGGEISVSSTPGKGSTFTVKLWRHGHEI